MYTSQRRFVWTVAVAAILAVVFLPAPAAAQAPAGQVAGQVEGQDEGQGAVLERLAPGFGIRAITVNGGLFSLEQAAPGSPVAQGNTARYMGAGGAGMEVGWRPASRTNLTDFRYRLDQNWNSSYDQLNGMDHVLTLSTVTGVGTRWRRGFHLNAESRLYSSLLFAAPALATASAPATGGPSDLGSSMGETGLGLNSPLVASYFGSRRNAGGAGFDVSFAKSPRTTWFTAGNISHQLAAPGSEEGDSRELLQPAVTMGTASSGFLHSVSRSTTVGMDVDASRTESSAFRNMSGALMGNVTHQLKGGLSVFARAGYSLTDQLGVADRAARGVQGSAGVTGTRGVHAVRLSAYRDNMDRFALDVERTIGADAIWNVTGRSSPWSSSLSFGYMKLTRFGTEPVEGVVARGLISRRIARNLSLGFDLAYATIAGRIPSLISDLTQGGARVFLTYTPQP